MSDIFLNGELKGVCSEELAEAIGMWIEQKDASIEKLKAENAKMRKELVQIANIAHHGGLTGLGDNDIRRLTLPYWDKAEAALLEGK